MPTLASLRLTMCCAALTAVSASCASRRSTQPPPRAEFVVTAGDSAFWVTTADVRFRLRRAPLTLANIRGRFYELYVADDDRSYFDAMLVGQRIYRRDLVSGDSIQIFEDRRVSAIARAYAAEHPRERRLDDDEEGSDEPHTVATSDAELLDVVGPLLSFAYSTDIDIANVEDTHVVRHGVVDLRDGSTVTLHGVFGDSIAHRIIAEGRAAYRTVIDSVRRTRGPDGRRAARAIDAFQFDSTSFAIVDIDGAPMVGFYVPGEGGPAGGLSLPLPHVRAPQPSWWGEIAVTIPKLSADSVSEIWNGPRYDVIAHYDTSGEFATLVVRDSTQHEWNATRLPTPARRVYRLDTPDVDTSAVHALARAFDESSLYSGAARTVSGPPRARAPFVRVSRPVRHLTGARHPRSVSRPAPHRLDRR
jgi:hypothetical protein